MFGLPCSKSETPDKLTHITARWILIEPTRQLKPTTRRRVWLPAFHSYRGSTAGARHFRISCSPVNFKRSTKPGIRFGAATPFGRQPSHPADQRVRFLF